MIVFSGQCSFSQVNKQKQDSIKIQNAIQKFSEKGKPAKFFRRVLFEPAAKQYIKKNSYHKSINFNYAPFEGKIIRKITLATLDPFGYSEIDSTKVTNNNLNKLGNTLHYRTRKITIKNLLLIKTNQPLDSLLLKESERLIRSQKYIRAVSTTINLVSESSDSVDVYMRVLDSWSLIPSFSTSTSKSMFKLTDSNFLGLGHEFSNTVNSRYEDNKTTYSMSYSIPNVVQKSIKTAINYQKDFEDNDIKSINIERPFFSAYSHWAGGIYFDEQFKKEVMIRDNLIFESQNIKYNSQDYWVGKSFPLFNGITEYFRTTNMFVNARFFNKKYTEQPDIAFDSLQIISSEKLYLASVGFASRKYTQDKFLFNFNVTEDIASGFLYAFTAGYQVKNNIGRYYFGAKIAIGKFFTFGYLSTSIDYGTYFKEKTSEQSALNLNLVYFTNLIETNRWKFRQFIKPQVVLGYNRIASNRDKLNLGGASGIQGFDNSSLFGTKKIVVNFQTQGYSPWNNFGFRFNPYFNCSLGMLSSSSNNFSKSKLYSQIGIGFIMSNDYLVFNSIQFSFSYYPSIPNDGSNVFKTNSFKTYDFLLPNYEITKPLLVSYQ